MTTVVKVTSQNAITLRADPRFLWVGRHQTFAKACSFPRSPFCNPYGRGTANAQMAMRDARDFEAELRLALAEPECGRVHPLIHTIARRLPELRGKRLGCLCVDWGGGEETWSCHAVCLAKLADGVSPANEFMKSVE